METFIQKILCRGNGFVDTRVIWGVLSLDKKYSPAQIDECAKEAMELGQLSYRLVERLLKLKPKEVKNPEKNQNSSEGSAVKPAVAQTEFKFLRSMETYKKVSKTTLH